MKKIIIGSIISMALLTIIFVPTIVGNRPGEKQLIGEGSTTFHPEEPILIGQGSIEIEVELDD